MNLDQNQDATGRNTTLLNRLDMDMDFKNRISDIRFEHHNLQGSPLPMNLARSNISVMNNQVGINVFGPSKTNVKEENRDTPLKYQSDNEMSRTTKNYLVAPIQHGVTLISQDEGQKRINQSFALLKSIGEENRKARK